MTPANQREFAQCEFHDNIRLVQIVIPGDDAKLAFVEKVGEGYCAEDGAYSIVELNDKIMSASSSGWNPMHCAS